MSVNKNNEINLENLLLDENGKLRYFGLSVMSPREISKYIRLLEG